MGLWPEWGRRFGRGRAAHSSIVGPHLTVPRKRKARPAKSPATSIDDVGAPILAVTLFVLAHCDRLFLAETHGMNAAALYAARFQRALDLLRAAGAQRQVVFPATAFVAVALNFNDRAGMLIQ